MNAFNTNLTFAKSNESKCSCHFFLLQAKHCKHGHFLPSNYNHASRYKICHFTCSVHSATLNIEIKYYFTYLVFSIFKNCNISENCINLKALKNLKPAREKRPQRSYF